MGVEVFSTLWKALQKIAFLNFRRKEGTDEGISSIRRTDERVYWKYFL